MGGWEVGGKGRVWRWGGGKWVGKGGLGDGGGERGG